MQRRAAGRFDLLWHRTNLHSWKTPTASVPASLTVDGSTFAIVDLPAIGGARLAQLPIVLRLLLENVVRHMDGPERDAAVAAIFGWLEHGTSEAEIAFQPGRVLMHDTTSTPALVDIAAMRDVLAEAGVDPSLLNPVLPVDVSVDHSLAVEAFGSRGALAENQAHELRRNARALPLPALGLEGAARRAHPSAGHRHHAHDQPRAAGDGRHDARSATASSWAVPDMMIGTDSHTPMINGIGVLGWGVGGLEAQTVMFGMPTMLRIPDVVGVHLSGALRPGVLATDLALVVTQRLRAIGVAGEFVEFFGPGVVDPVGRRALGGREHGAGVRLDDRLLPGRRAHARLPARDRSQRGGGRASSRPTAGASGCGSTPRRGRAARGCSRSTSRRSACMSPVRVGRRTCSAMPRPARRSRRSRRHGARAER